MFKVHQVQRVEYKATVVGIFRSFLARVAGEESFELSRGVGATHSLEWGKIGYS